MSEILDTSNINTDTLQALILEKQLEAVLDGLNQGDGEIFQPNRL